MNESSKKIYNYITYQIVNMASNYQNTTQKILFKADEHTFFMNVLHDFAKEYLEKSDTERFLDMHIDDDLILKVIKNVLYNYAHDYQHHQLKDDYVQKLKANGIVDIAFTDAGNIFSIKIDTRDFETKLNETLEKFKKYFKLNKIRKNKYIINFDSKVVIECKVENECLKSTNIRTLTDLNAEDLRRFLLFTDVVKKLY